MNIITSSALIFFSQLITADNSLLEQHESELTSIQQQEIVTREHIALEQTRIESLKLEIQRVSGEISNASLKKYELLGVNEQGLKETEDVLDSIKQSLESVLASGSDISTFKTQIDEFNNWLDRLRGKKIVRLPLISTRVQVCDSLISKISVVTEQSRQNVSQSLSESSTSRASSDLDTLTPSKPNKETQVDTWLVKYEGNIRESLFKIAGYPEVYGDSYKWPLLYEANKELIDQNFHKHTKNKNNSTDINPPDILFPGQILKIPR